MKEILIYFLSKKIWLLPIILILIMYHYITNILKQIFFYNKNLKKRNLINKENHNN